MIAGLAFVLPSQGQTIGTLSERGDFFWSTAPWVMTGSGTYPSGGGTATFAEQVGHFAGVLGDGVGVTLDVGVVLSNLAFDSSARYTISAGTGGSLSLTSTGVNTINVTRSPLSTLSLLSPGHVISAPIGGGGTFGLTKTGTGIVTLSGTNTYTGGTRILGGTLNISAVSSSVSMDAALGATGSGNDVTIDGGTLRVSDYSLTTSRNFTLGTSGGTVEVMGPTVEINGIVSGGALTKTGTGLLKLTGANTYTGPTTVVGGSLGLSGVNGSIAASSAYDFAASVTLGDINPNNNNDRLSDTAAITSRGASIRLLGNSSAATNEIAGSVNLSGGMNTLGVIANATQSASLQFAGITRTDNATLVLRGPNLGGTPGAGVGQLIALASPGTLIGGGGAAGSSTISILPWAFSNASSSSGVFTSSSFVTHDAATGRFRPLATSEFLSSFTGAIATSNVRLTGTTSLSGNLSANALLFAPGATATLSGGQISLTSGALLYSPTVANTSGSISSGLNFGSAEGIVTATSPLTISGAISGSGGVTFGAPSAIAITLSGASTYTGTTTLNAGFLQYSGTISNNGSASPFGASTSAIVMNTGTFSAGIQATAASTMNRDLLVRGSGSGLARFGTTGDFALTMNGNIELQRTLHLEGGSSAATALTLNGNISGTGSLTNATSSYIVLAGNNTYTGGTDIAPLSGITGLPTFPIFVAASNTAFGTGTIYFSGQGTIQGNGTAARVIANPLLFAANPIFGGAAPLTFTGAVDLNGSRRLQVDNSATTTLAGPISGGGLSKAGSGTLVLSNPTGNTYSGGTLITTAGGTLLISNTSGSATGSGAFDTVGGVTLAGTGFIDAEANKILIHGTLSPGPAAAGGNPGTIHLASSAGVGALTLGNNSTLLFDVGTASDLVSLTATGLRLDGGKLQLVIGTGFSYANTYTLFSGISDFTGQFYTVTGYDAANYTPIFTFTGDHYDLSFAPVPEPATWATGALLAVALLAARAKRRSSARPALKK